MIEGMTELEYVRQNSDRTMSTMQFLKRSGIKLKWYQKLHLFFYDLNNEFDRKFRPVTYLLRNYRR